MAGSLPLVPNNLLVQPGNGLVYLNWDPVVGATSYVVLRSTDNVTFTTLATPTTNSYSDTTAVVGTLYYYEVEAVNANGTSNPTASQSATPVNTGIVSLGQVRLAAQQRADMVNNNFVTTQEWNSYINHSYTELYDILVQTYGQEYYASSTAFVTDARNPALYPLPVNHYKLLGVDLGLSPSNNAYVTLKNFPFIARNRYIYGNTPVSMLGVLNLRYRQLGSNILFVPNPSPNQQVQLWYIPRPSTLLKDNDFLDGISGWDEYVIIDASIKAMQKEESDVAVLMAQKADMRKRIEAAASNRDVGQPEAVSDVRRMDGGYFCDPFGDQSGGGW